jgi:hypothetical protein
MIKFKTFNVKTQRPFIGFGLSDKNIELLKENKPIVINGKDMDSDVDFMIFWGKTEEEMYEDLKEFIGKDTKVHGTE